MNENHLFEDFVICVYVCVCIIQIDEILITKIKFHAYLLKCPNGVDAGVDGVDGVGLVGVFSLFFLLFMKKRIKSN